MPRRTSGSAVDAGTGDVARAAAGASASAASIAIDSDIASHRAR
jgi:hypothetical protein